MTNIAFLGLGSMGARMAARLLEAGHVLTLYNRTAARAQALVERGARLAASPREAVRGADIVISMLTDDEASRKVWLDESDGALAAMATTTIAIASSTLTPTWIDELDAAVMGRGSRFLYAPVVGTLPQAEGGDLIYLAGGQATTLDTVRAELLAMGGVIHHTGEMAGSAAVMKLAINASFGIQVAALAELLAMITRSGVEAGRALAILGEMPVTSPAARGIGALIAARKFAPLFPIDLVHKDFGYVVDTAKRVGTSTPTTAAVREVLAQARRAGFGGDNITGVAKLYD